MGKIKMAGEMLLYNREPSQALCDDLEGWVGKSRERLNREGIYVYSLHNYYYDNYYYITLPSSLIEHFP